ncbi:MAG: energy transducer TonB [Acidobacteriota bacterium]|nr:energy transducer TonB [Acidobacteriota bacterium]
MKNRMRKTAFIVCLAIAVAPAVWAGPESASATIKMRFLEGVREAGKPGVAVVTSSYLQPVFSGALEARDDLESERKQIARVFNLKDVRLITEADLAMAAPKGLGKPGEDQIKHRFRMNGREFGVALTPRAGTSGVLPIFRLQVEETVEAKTSEILDTAFQTAAGKTAVFGFESAAGEPYFLSLRFEGEILGTVRAIGRIQPPKLIRKTEPVYPEIARQARVDGIVILEVMTDIYGRVQNVKVLRSIPLLDQAAVDAVRQWIYEPMIIDGKPRPILFTVTVRFAPDKDKDKDIDKDVDKEKEEEIGGVAGDVYGAVGLPIKARGDIKPPKLIRIVEPVYPEEAREKGIDGIVILEAVTDIYGRVADARILKSIPELDQAAIDAVRQWLYEPMIIDGKPHPVIFTVTVRFQKK